MKIKTGSIIIELQQEEIEPFKFLIDKVERYRCNEGETLILSKEQAKILVKLHNYFFGEE